MAGKQQETVKVLPYWIAGYILLGFVSDQEAESVLR